MGLSRSDHEDGCLRRPATPRAGIRSLRSFAGLMPTHTLAPTVKISAIRAALLRLESVNGRFRQVGRVWTV